jgi:ankyrin repeat protein
MGRESYPSQHTQRSSWDLTADQWAVPGDRTGIEFVDSLYHPWNHNPARDITSSMCPIQSNALMEEESNVEVLSLLAECVGASAGSENLEYPEQISSGLEDLTIEMHDGQLGENVVRLKGPSRMESVFQLIRYFVYLSSNNLLSDSKTDKIVKWMTKTGSPWVLDLLLDLKISSTEIFGSNLLVCAARLGELDIVRRLVAKGVEVNVLAGRYSRKTPLQAAMVAHHFPIVQLLLNAGADPNHQIGSDFSVLHDALSGPSNIETVRLLIDTGADVNGPFNDYYNGYPLLISAVEMQDHAMVQTLLEAGARIDQLSVHSGTALQACAKKGNVEIAQTLIDAGANIDAPAGDAFEEAREIAEDERIFEYFTTPIQRAAQADSTELVRILVFEGADINACPWEEYIDEILHEYDDDPSCTEEFPTALQAAVFHSNHVLVRVLLGANAIVDARGCGSTPLQMAAAIADSAIVKILQKHGADINAPARDEYGRTALQAAASTGDRELVQQLLGAGAEINAVPSRIGGRTAVQAAAENGHAELVETLIEAGANLNADAGPENGRTCLQGAAEGCHAELVFLLLIRGADVNSPAATELGELTALQAALTLFHPKARANPLCTKDSEPPRTGILQALLDAGADINTPPSPRRGISTAAAAVKSGSLELTRALLLRGLDISQRDIDINSALDGKTALGEAVVQGSEELVCLLVEAGANLNAWYGIGEYPHHATTALGVAALMGNMPITRILLANGADPNACVVPQKKLKTALEEALTPLQINIYIVIALIDAGADVNKINYLNQGHLVVSFVPLVHAATRANLEIVQLLLKAGASIDLRSKDGEKDGETALQAAIQTRKFDLVQTLIDAGANINAPAGNAPAWSWQPRTALQGAAEQSDIRVVELLLSHGADVNAPARHRYGITALQGAMLKGNIKIVLMLLKAGARINAPGAIVGGRTALEAAAEHGRLDIVHLLLQNDDEPEVIEHRCKLAAEFAADNGHQVIARILRKHRAVQGYSG